MIRKISLFIIALIIGAWLIAGHIIKNKLIIITSNFASDNIKFSYKDTELSGFPFYWQITYIDPKIEIINQKHSSEISLPQFNVKINYLIKDVDLQFGNLAYYDWNKNGVISEYKIVSTEDIVMNLKFDESLCFLNSVLDWNKAGMSVNLDIARIDTINNSKIFSLSDINLSFHQKNNNEISNKDIKLITNYSSSENDLRIKKAYLMLDLEYLTNNTVFNINKKLDFEHKINLSKISLKLDDSFLDISGSLKFNRDSAPRGDLNISINNPNLISEFLLSDNFISRNPSIKPIISKLNLSNLPDDNDNYQKSDFKVHFSDKGISIGKLNYIESKTE